MKKKTYKKEITVIELEGEYDGFCVEVSKRNDDVIDLYLCHTDYAVKDLMFGVSEEFEDSIEQLIESNVEEYIETYIRKHFDA